MAGGCLHPVMMMKMVVMVMKWMNGVVVLLLRRSSVRRVVRQAGNAQRVLRVAGIRAHRPMVGRWGPETRIAAEPVLGAAAAARRCRHHRRCARVQPPRRRQGRAGHRHRAFGNRTPRQGPRR